MYLKQKEKSSIPCIYGEDLSLNIDSNRSEIDFELAIDAARYYGVEEKEAIHIII